MPKAGGMRILKVGRDARTGRFLPISVAERRRLTAVVETYRVPKRRSSSR